MLHFGVISYTHNQSFKNYAWSQQNWGDVPPKNYGPALESWGLEGRGDWIWWVAGLLLVLVWLAVDNFAN